MAGQASGQPPFGEVLDVPKATSTMKLAYRISLVCGFLPLFAGVAIFVLWLITRWNWLMVAGTFAILGGTAIVMVGVLALARFWWLARRDPGRSRRRLWRSIAASGLLLLSNFPVAAGIVIAAVSVETSYTVTVHNASGQALLNVRAIGGGCDESFGSIPPGADATRTFWIKTDGTLEFQADRATTSHTETIEGYVTHGVGGRATVTVHDDGTIAVRSDGP